MARLHFSHGPAKRRQSLRFSGMLGFLAPDFRRCLYRSFGMPYDAGSKMRVEVWGMLRSDQKPGGMEAGATGKLGRGRVFDSITETIGETPLVRLNRLPQLKAVKAHILAKLEFFNPLGSVK